MIVYYNGAFMPQEQVCISPEDRGFLFADGVYEVICAIDGHLFQADAHLQRLAHSLNALRIEGPAPSELLQIAISLLEHNSLMQGGAKLYIQITRGSAPRRHAFPDPPVPPTVYATAVAFHPPTALWKTGVSGLLVPDTRWARCDIKSLALLPNVLASQAAHEAGAYDAIFTREGVITEGAHTSICGIYQGLLLTHPLGPRILGSVTRQVVLNLCDTLGIPYREEPIPTEMLPRLDELMFLGTTTGVMPIVAVDGHPIGSGKPGPITIRLQQALWRLMNGQDPH